MSNVSSAKKTGRPPKDTEAVNTRFERDMLNEIDTFIAQQPDPKPSRPEAVRRLTAEGLISWGVRDAAKNV